MTDLQHAKLLNAITEHDKKESKKRGYNPYALSHYCQALANTREAVEKGKTLRQALVACFLDRLRDKLLRAVGEPDYVRYEEQN